jgi:ferredoxin
MLLGFPATKSDSDIRLLRYFFKPNEIQILLQLNFKYKSTREIYESLKSSYSKDKIDAILERLKTRGVIGWKEENDEIYYKLLPLIVGLDESQNYNRSLKYLKLMREYLIESGFAVRLATSKVPQFRTIPVEQSLEPGHIISAYDDVNTIIDNIEGDIVLIDCICRKSAILEGKKCKQTDRLETCLVFNEVASRWLERDLGRKITKEEALAILKKNEEDGLVLQPSNSKNPNFLCSCCGCCCGVLSLQKVIPNPAKYWTSSYQALIDPSLCEGCKSCIQRCQVDAISLKNEKATVNLKRCIGCGNCTQTCPTQAIHLIKKEEMPKVPKNSEELYDSIMKTP